MPTVDVRDVATRRRLAGSLVMCALLAGCAARSAAERDAEALARAADLTRQGCYACLQEARDIYEHLQHPRLREAVHPHRFELELLLALRERELAIDAAGTLARARALAPGLPPDVDGERYLALVEAMPPDARGTPIRDRPAGPTPRAAWGRESRVWLDERIDLPLLRDYLIAAVECLTSQTAARPAASPEEAPPPAGPPLLAYRRAACGGLIDAAGLAQVAGDVPDFIETALFQARTPLGTAGTHDGFLVRARLAEAFERLPHSSAIPHQLGTIMTTLRDHRAAADYYTATLALRDRHEEARLGRAVAFGYLDRFGDAIADLTILIDEATSLRGDAYYWRAWNRHRRGELDLARADIEGAKSIRREPHVLTLAGIIEHDQKDFGIARDDLTLSVRLNSRDCTARWYLGLVELAGESWLEGAEAFAQAAACYAESAADNERQRELMARREDLEPDFRAGQMAGFEAAIEEDRSQESAAAFNAAVNYARAGHRADAMRHLERAEQDAARHEAGAALRKVLGVLGQ